MPCSWTQSCVQVIARWWSAGKTSGAIPTRIRSRGASSTTAAGNDERRTRDAEQPRGRCHAFLIPNDVRDRQVALCGVAPLRGDRDAVADGTQRIREIDAHVRAMPVHKRNLVVAVRKTREHGCHAKPNRALAAAHGVQAGESGRDGFKVQQAPIDAERNSVEYLVNEGLLLVARDLS